MAESDAIIGKDSSIEVVLGESTISPEKHQVVLSKPVLDAIGASSGDKVQFRIAWKRNLSTGESTPVVIIEKKKPGP